MGIWIALLKGVNVGGNNKLPMAEFRALLTGLGFGEVATYIQSGNAVFEAEGTAPYIAKQIGKGLKAEFGIDVDIFVLSRADLQNALQANPYLQAVDDPKTQHLIFLPEPVPEIDLADMQEFATNGERFELHKNVFYFWTPNGFSQSKLSGKLPRFIKSSMTARNLRSCQKILELAQAI